jgi:hypothetical protein
MINLIANDKSLTFEAVSGMYDGSMVSYHPDMEWLMWKDDNTYMPISFNSEFMKTKWRLLEGAGVVLVEIPLFSTGLVCCVLS